VKVNGVETRLAYASGSLAILPKTLDGQVVPAARPRLVSLRTADLDAETFGYAAASLTAFGDPVPGGPRSVAADALFTGKPHVDGLGYAFLFRNYRPGLGKWQTADPLGYPDGWNRLAYCENWFVRRFSETTPYDYVVRIKWNKHLILRELYE